MKALTISQPYASLIADGRKWIGIDARESQAALVERRVKEANERKGAA